MKGLPKSIDTATYMDAATRPILPDNLHRSSVRVKLGAATIVPLIAPSDSDVSLLSRCRFPQEQQPGECV